MEIEQISEDEGTPELTERQKQEAQDRTSVSAVVVHEAIRSDGEDELNRPGSALAWSAFAAGLSMGFSLVGESLLRAHLPDTTWRALIVSLGYALGFLVVIVGRQQLFTENTLTAIIPLLARRDRSTLVRVLRLWSIVLVCNMAGASLFALVVARTEMFRPDVQQSMMALAEEAASVTFGSAVLRGVFAGWLIALMVWMLAAVDTGRLAIIVIVTYTVALANLTHIIAGAVEMFFLVWRGAHSLSGVSLHYLLPTLIGNILGGVTLTAALNHAQVIAGSKK